MIDRRIQLLVTTIVKVVARGTPLPQFLAGSLPGEPIKPRFGEPKSLAGNDGHLRRVLVVDDEKLIADSVATILNRSGFAAVATYSGTGALESIQERSPDIIVSDVLCRISTGFNWLKQFAQSAPAPELSFSPAMWTQRACLMMPQLKVISSRFLQSPYTLLSCSRR